jgi:opacity protein-like surface antigen
MKRRFLVLVLALAALGAPCFADAVRLTGDLSANFLGGSTTQQIVNTFAVGDQPLFWGFGWEVILGRVGFGADYMVSFFRQAGTQWWLDWYSPALYLSFHPLGANRLLDPFLQMGLGCAGRVLLTGGMGDQGGDLLISLFPTVAAGLNLNLEGLLLGVKATYTPFKTAIPVTDIPAYPLGNLQVSLSAGFSIGW